MWAPEGWPCLSSYRVSASLMGSLRVDWFRFCHSMVAGLQNVEFHDLALEVTYHCFCHRHKASGIQEKGAYISPLHRGVGKVTL